MHKGVVMEEAVFSVQGSAANPYQVHFVKYEDNNLSAYCDCPAGSNGQCCKHRFNILAGQTKGIVSPNKREVAKVQSWLPGSDVETALTKMRGLEAEQERIKKALSAAKKDVARAMRD